MKIVGLETFLCNGGLCNYLFVRLHSQSFLNAAVIAAHPYEPSSFSQPVGTMPG